MRPTFVSTWSVKMRKYGMLFFGAMLVPAGAEARSYHHHYHHVSHVRQQSDYGDSSIVGHPAGCPARDFCGCGVSAKVFGHPVRDLYLASAWLKYPRAAAAPGRVMITRGHGPSGYHVSYIESVSGNTAVVYDPNSGGHATRVHTVALTGTIVDPR